MQPTLDVIEILDGESRVVELRHGEDIHGRRFIACIRGDFCDCDWCRSLCRRMRSQRVSECEG